MARHRDPNFKKIKKDPLGRIGMEAVELYRIGRTNTSEAQNKLEKAYRLLTAGIQKCSRTRNSHPMPTALLRPGGL